MTAAAEHLRAVEVELLGRHAERRAGAEIEKGSGSAYARLPQSARQRHVDAEAFVAAEKAERQARDELAAANAKHVAAVAALKAIRSKCGLENAVDA
ncbi:hypothetical protein H8A95_21925 [Bradyrhizobium sp. Pear76]|uniref:hypothetical protein n=1 Tax=Bradyrhizobium oropedii TaxID=1571201 RepID=UPI001E5698C4|nr:hypothetical protein [Bradyrhizobium oropedii]MCC8964897.1 hypothetical protein [Bradyrhizobium oropedii]